VHGTRARALGVADAAHGRERALERALSRDRSGVGAGEQRRLVGEVVGCVGIEEALAPEPALDARSTALQRAWS
jgi:hypothetical protein